jgi:hypothetical protein
MYPHANCIPVCLDRHMYYPIPLFLDAHKSVRQASNISYHLSRHASPFFEDLLNTHAQVHFIHFSLVLRFVSSFAKRCWMIPKRCSSRYIAMIIPDWYSIRWYHQNWWNFAVHRTIPHWSCANLRISHCSCQIYHVTCPVYISHFTSYVTRHAPGWFRISLSRYQFILEECL